MIDRLTESAALRIKEDFVPEFSLKLKSDSKLQKFIGFILRLVGNKSYMTHFWTTIGYTVYRPTEMNAFQEDLEYSVIWHEGVHARQAQRLTRPLMGILYLLPLTAAPLPIIIAFFTTWWMLVPAAVLLLPLPAWFRMRMELEAYTVSMIDEHLTTGLSEARALSYAAHFTGPNYYYMWPFKSYINKQLLSARSRILAGDVDAYGKGFISWMKENYLTS